MPSQSETFSEHDPRNKPESLRLREVAASLTVGDLEASLKWYHEVVGFTVAERHEQDGHAWATLVAGDVRLVLAQDDWAMGKDRVKGAGMRLYLTTAQDVDELAEQIRSRGGALDSDPANLSWGPRAVALTDPDGFKLTIASTV